jgi:hypothetical protein
MSKLIDFRKISHFQATGITWTKCKQVASAFFRKIASILWQSKIECKKLDQRVTQKIDVAARKELRLRFNLSSLACTKLQQAIDILPFEILKNIAKNETNLTGDDFDKIKLMATDKLSLKSSQEFGKIVSKRYFKSDTTKAATDAIGKSTEGIRAAASDMKNSANNIEKFIEGNDDSISQKTLKKLRCAADFLKKDAKHLMIWQTMRLKC